MTPYQTPERIKLKFDAIKEPKSFWKGERVLDIGSAEGMLYPLLKECGVSQYIGLENSSEYIQVARWSFPDASFVLGDMRELSKLGILADIIVSLSTFHILTDREFKDMIRDCAKTAKTLIFEVPVLGSSPIYHTRSEEKNMEIAGLYFKEVSCYGISPSPHDLQSTRKVFKCVN
jgi:cyclopropane fatty-acyl-phospholipid synthase-like methyltransferase